MRPKTSVFHVALHADVRTLTKDHEAQGKTSTRRETRPSLAEDNSKTSNTTQWCSWHRWTRFFIAQSMSMMSCQAYHGARCCCHGKFIRTGMRIFVWKTVEGLRFSKWLVCCARVRLTTTMIHSGTLCIQRKVTKCPCFGGFVFRAQFQHFLSAFWRSSFPMQLALVSMSTITPTLSLSVFSLQRTRLFRTCGELWRTRGELWLYFEMQRQLDLWSFSWSSRRSREAQK